MNCSLKCGVFGLNVGVSEHGASGSSPTPEPAGGAWCVGDAVPAAPSLDACAVAVEPPPVLAAVAEVALPELGAAAPSSLAGADVVVPASLCAVAAPAGVHAKTTRTSMRFQANLEDELGGMFMPGRIT